jgi:hypothetical protein
VAASGDEDTGGLAAHQELLKIEQLLAFANFLFHKKKYNDAVNAYKATLGKILEHPSQSGLRSRFQLRPNKESTQERSSHLKGRYGRAITRSIMPLCF